MSIDDWLLKKQFFMKKTLVISLLSLVFCLLSVPVHAQIDQRCFKHNDCIEARQAKGITDPKILEEGWYHGPETIGVCNMDKDPAGAEIGFCLPAYSATTNIGFGGRHDFLHIGEFIQYIYRYGITIASVLALIVIIFSGFEYITGGLSPERMNSAKKRITGAIVGLVIALISFALLTRINPALVNFRLPQVWMVNPIGLAPPYCDQLTSGRQISNSSLPPAAQKDEATKKQFLANMEYGKTQPDAVPCGEVRAVENTGGLTCDGRMCKDGFSCYKRFGDTQIKCQEGLVHGIIRTTNLTQKLTEQISTFAAFSKIYDESWTFPWATRPILYGVCADGTYKTDSYLSTANDPDSTANEDDLVQEFWIYGDAKKFIEEINEGCAANGGIKGFVVSLLFNESLTDIHEEHAVGKGSVDLGDIGCLSPVGGCNLGLIKTWGVAEKIAKAADKNLFISPEELQKSLQFDIDVGKICDIDFKSSTEDRKKCYSQFGF